MEVSAPLPTHTHIHNGGECPHKWWVLPPLNYSGGENSVHEIWTKFNKIWFSRSRSITPRNNTALDQGVLHHWSKFGDPNLNGWWVIMQINSWLTQTHWHGHTYAGNGNLPNGQKWPWVQIGKNHWMEEIGLVLPPTIHPQKKQTLT